MNIESLRVFYRTVCCKSISKAARELYISQPAVSLQIKSLEKEIKLKLLERSNKGIVPTKAGEIVYNYAENILGLYENMICDTSCFDGRKVNRITISCCPTLGQYSLPCIMYEFKKRHPEVEVHIEHNFSCDVVKQIKNRGVDIGFIECSCDEDNIECIPVGNAELLFTAPPGLLNNNVLKKEDITKYVFFLIHRKSGLRKIIEDSLNKSGICTNCMKLSIEFPSIESIKSSVVSGRGLSILPYLAIKKELNNKDLLAVQVDKIRFPYSFSLIYSRRSKNFIKSEFIDYMNSEGKNILCT